MSFVLTVILVPPVKSTAKLNLVTTEYVKPPSKINNTIGKTIFPDFTKSNFLNGILTSLAGIIFFFDKPINRFGLLSNTPVFANKAITAFDINTNTIIVNKIFIIN